MDLSPRSYSLIQIGDIDGLSEVANNEVANNEIVESSSAEGNQNISDSDSLIDRAIINLNKCADGMRLDVEVASLMQEHYFGKSKPLLTNAEDALLSLAVSETTDAIFFICLLRVEMENPIYIARYFENGAFKGFYDTFVHKELKSKLAIEQILPYQVYTAEDIMAEMERNKDLFKKKKKGKPDQSRAYKRLLFQNKGGVNTSIKDILLSFSVSGILSCPMLLCYCLNKCQQWEESVDPSGLSQRYIICHPLEIHTRWEECMNLYRVNPSDQLIKATIWDAVDEELTLEEQFRLISTLPNYHKWNWGEHVVKIKSYQKLSNSCRAYPTSPRNRILQACCFRPESRKIVSSCLQNIRGLKVKICYPTTRGKKSKTSMKTVIGVEPEEDTKYASNSDTEIINEDDDMVNIDHVNVTDQQITADLPSCRNEEFTIPVPEPFEYIEDDINNEELPINSHGEDNLAGTIISPNEMVNDEVQYSTEPVLLPCPPKSISLYQYFCMELTSRGRIHWRVFENDRQIIVMNDYSCENGNLLTTEFVHVTCQLQKDILTVSCTCKIYSTLVPSHMNRISTHDAVDCCHARWCRDIYPSTLDLVDPQAPLNKYIPLNKVLEGIPFHKISVVELPAKKSIKRYSVNANKNPQIVTIQRVIKTRRKIIKCHSSRCQCEESNTRNVKLLKDDVIMCPHLTEFKSFFFDQLDFMFGEDSDDEDSGSGDGLDDINLLPNVKWQEVFDVKTGLWRFSKNAPSNQRVDRDPKSESLKYNVKLRQLIDLCDESEFRFTPTIPTACCECGAGWVSEEFPNGRLTFSEKTNLYLAAGVKYCNVYVLSCLANICKLYWTGEDDSIFRISKVTCAGYELGWQFVAFIMNGKNTFRGFVTYHNEIYSLSDPHGESFMSVRLFIDWFFAWSSRMNFEFRQTCKWCKGDTVSIACDGTQLGIGFKHTFVSPIETPTKTCSVDFSTRRHDRCFIFNKGKDDVTRRRTASARLLLQNTCKAIKKNDVIYLSDAANIELIKQIPSFLPSEAIDAFKNLLCDIPTLLKSKYATVFEMLSHDSCIDAVIPLRYCDEVIEYCQSLNLSTSDFCHQMQFYCIEFSDLVLFSSEHNQGFPSRDVLSLLLYCAEAVKHLHSFDTPPEPAIPIPGTYNPPKYGRAYYFTEHGSQVREMRKFPIDKGATNYDDIPANKCEKSFKQISHKGISFMFLWFCPLHGHCYGYHIIPGSEGRKDAAASLYTHLPKAPKQVFYDFACSLSEYSHNRESGYFQDTRYFHDVFHGFSHKCSKVFRCDRLLGFDAYNTSICEQFNSFIQSIKTSSKLMTQCHFSFYLQFFIHIWNEKKYDSFKKRMNIAMRTGE